MPWWPSTWVTNATAGAGRRRNNRPPTASRKPSTGWPAWTRSAGQPPSVEVFRRTLDGELETSLRRVGHLGDGVLVGHVSMAIGLDLDRVVVLGMAEGAFPPRRLEDSLLPDEERRAAGGELALRAERVHDDHRQLLAAMAAAEPNDAVFSPR